jgi:hypothetical protein
MMNDETSLAELVLMISHYICVLSIAIMIDINVHEMRSLLKVEGFIFIVRDVLNSPLLLCSAKWRF